jgi:hypothetical protein
MILNVSGRTDVVAFYTNWFFKRLDEGFVDVRNPYYPKKVSRIYFEDVDMFVFCTKNPLPILNKIHLINKPILFHITLTPYKKDIEPNVPPKGLIIEGIKKLSKIIGAENIYLRYDPIFINDKYTIEYHVKAFNNLCNLLDGYINNIIISFVDDYKNVRKNLNILKIKNLTNEDYKKIGTSFSECAKKHNMTVMTCFEQHDLVEYGFKKDDCISKKLALKMTWKNFPKWKARGGKCNCVEMVDIGEYNSCMHFCKYCYANYDENLVIDKFKRHDENSSLLVGNLTKDDEIVVRKK